MAPLTLKQKLSFRLLVLFVGGINALAAFLTVPQGALAVAEFFIVVGCSVAIFIHDRYYISIEEKVGEDEPPP